MNNLNINKMSFATIEERPLQMPKNYDFSTRGVDWKKYENFFLLRTDAVWEKSKLLSIFYSTYKAVRKILNAAQSSCQRKYLL